MSITQPNLFIFLEKRHRPATAREELIERTWKKALIEIHSLAERVAGLLSADLLAELDLSALGTELRAGCEERVLFTGHALRCGRIRIAVRAEERLDFSNLVRNLHLTIVDIKRLTLARVHRDEPGDKRPQPSWLCN